MSYKKFAATQKRVKSILGGTTPTVVLQGYRAFEAGVSPDHSPYINKDGDNRTYLPDWLLGWSLAYRQQALDGFAPAFLDGAAKVMGTENDEKLVNLLKKNGAII